MDAAFALEGRPLSLDPHRLIQAFVRVHRLVPIDKIPLLPARPPLTWPVTLAGTPEELTQQLFPDTLTHLCMDAMQYASKGRFTRPVPGLGAWYAAESVDTCVQEVAHHFLAGVKAADTLTQTRTYQVIEALVCDALYDASTDPQYAQASAQVDTYTLTQVFGDLVRAGRWAGIRYPSKRNAGGVCYALLRPDAIRAVNPTGQLIRLTYRPDWNAPDQVPVDVQDVTPR